MVHRSLLGAAVFAASLLLLSLPAVSSAQARPSSATHTPSASLSALLARGEKECVQPSGSLDPKTLSDAQLALYGLPTHKVLDSDPSFWSGMLAHYKHRACGSSIRMPFPGPDQRVTRARAAKTGTGGVRDASGKGTNWAGNWATGDRGTYQIAEDTFEVPSISGNIGAMVSFWAGVGGAGNTSPFALVQDGVAIVNCPTSDSGPQCLTALNNGTLPTSGSTWLYNYAWYEIVNSADDACTAELEDCLPVAMTGIRINQGNSMTAYVASNYEDNPYDFFSVCNNTTSTCANPVYNYNASSFSDSAAGECIGEEPAVTNAGGSDYYEANFGTEEIDDCNLTTSTGDEQGIGEYTHSYGFILDTAGKTLVKVGDVTGDGLQNYALEYCTKATETNDNCG